MRSTMRKLLARRAVVVAMGMGLALFLAGGSYALTGHTSHAPKGPQVEASESPDGTESPTPEATETSDSHGGSVDRFHDAGVCNLTDVSTLAGNWTHGDYVSAVAAADPTKVKDAAQSDCGKPMSAVGPHGKSGDTHGKS